MGEGRSRLKKTRVRESDYDLVIDPGPQWVCVREGVGVGVGLIS